MLLSVAAAFTLLAAFAVTPMSPADAYAYPYACRNINVARNVQEGSVHIPVGTIYVTGILCSNAYGNVDRSRSTMYVSFAETWQGLAAGLIMSPRGGEYTYFSAVNQWYVRAPGQWHTCLVRVIPICSYNETWHVDVWDMDTITQPPAFYWGNLACDNTYCRIRWY